MIIYNRCREEQAFRGRLAVERYEIDGGRPLVGEVSIQGSKNAVLPMMAAAVLHQGTVVLEHCPVISDVQCMVRILEKLGCTVNWEGHTLIIDAQEIRSVTVPEKEAKRMRSSVMLLGALLGRKGKARLCYPGGCVIGRRPIDLHLSALEQMGAAVTQEDDWLDVSASRLTGQTISFARSSVGATENVLLAAVLAEGVTVIRGAAMEPEIGELCRLLGRMGADISGVGTPVIRVCGVKRLHDARVTVMPDRIVAGTYLLAAAGSGGRLTIENPPVGQLDALLGILRQLEMEVREEKGTLSVVGKPHFPALPFVQTAEYPGFPTDLQSQLLAVLLRARGTSRVRETIFESRFRAAEEFRKLGGQVDICGQDCTVHGTESLAGAVVESHELRGGAALLLAGIFARGTTTVLDEGYIARGYEQPERVLSALGAHIEKR